MKKFNWNNKLFWKFISFLMITSMLVFFNQCVVQEYEMGATGTTNQDVGGGDDYHSDDDVVDIPVGGSGEFSETGATEVARTVTSVGTNDFEEIYYTMSTVTGINPADESSIRNLYQDLKTQLPFDASIKIYTTANQIAIIKLGAEYCHQLFNRSQYYNNFFTNFNIGQNPNQVLSDENSKQVMITDFINKFWGQDTQPQNVEDVARQELSILIDDLLVGENMNSTTTTRTVAKGVCTSLIASAPLVLL